MTFTESIRTVYGKYIDFAGRASRSEYWWFALYNICVGAVFSILGFIFHNSAGAPAGWVSTLACIYSLVNFLPGLGVSVRRMHDIGKGGGWIFIGLIPIIGLIWFIVLAATDSEQGPNRFGPLPD